MAAVQDSMIESLPPELRCNILSQLDLHGLLAMVEASPVYRRQYNSARRLILICCMQTTFGIAVVDVLAAYRSGSHDFSHARTDATVTDFLDRYTAQRASNSFLDLFMDLTEQDLIKVAAYFINVVDPLKQRFVTQALGKLGPHPSQNNDDCSITEKIRLMRAFYRYQLGCNLFVVGCQPCGGRSRIRLRPSDILERFFYLFEPWEAEDIVCVHTYTQKEFQWAFDVAAPRYGQPNHHELNTERQWSDWGELLPCRCESFFVDKVAPGLDSLCRVLAMVEDDLVKVLVAMPNKRCCGVEGFMVALYWPARIALRQRNGHGSFGAAEEQLRLPLAFGGDDESSPPLGWTTLWRGTCSSLFGIELSHDHRCWGFVMWDAWRIQQAGREEDLSETWERKNRGIDPRDTAAHDILQALPHPPPYILPGCPPHHPPLPPLPPGHPLAPPQPPIMFAPAPVGGHFTNPSINGTNPTALHHHGHLPPLVAPPGQQP